jgi:molecular chaperone DnaK
VPQIEVTFDIDANGIVNVSAKDKATGKEQQIRIQASGGLSEEDIEQMVKDAEAHAEEDKKRKELIDAKNQADSLIYSTEKALGEHGDKIEAAEKSSIEGVVAELKSAVEAEDLEQIQAKTQELASVSMKLGEAMYQSSGGDESGGTGGGETGGGSQDDVVDADFEEVDDDKKKSA